VVGAAPPYQLIEPTTSLRAWLRDVWSFRDVLWALCRRDLRGKYKQAALGVSWAIVQPIVQTAVFTLVFRGIASIRTDVPYPVFALAALAPFNLFQQVVAFGAPSFVSAQAIVTKIYFPRIYTVLASATSAFVNCVLSLILLLFALAMYGVPLRPTSCLALIPLLGIAMLAIGTAALLATLNARFRDVQHALPLLMTALMFVSPVLYPPDAIPIPLRPLMAANPLGGLIEAFRALLLGLPSHSWVATATCGCLALAVFVLGIWVFERFESRLIDVL
jgi:lipopolysaccharide transport system permease protein